MKKIVIVSDPPYGATRLKWDKAAPAIDELVSWQNQVSAMILCCNHKLLADLITNLKFPFHDLVIWNKTPNRTWVSWSKPLRSTELIAFFGTSENFDFRKTLEPQEPYEANRRVKGQHFGDAERKQPKQSWPVWEQVWEIPVEKNKKHNTQKPLELMRRLVQIAAFAGAELIVDPFEGSGTTGEACKLVGIEYEGSDSGAWVADKAAQT